MLTKTRASIASVILLTVITQSLAGCSWLFPRAAPVSNPQTLYVWPKATCPAKNGHAGQLGSSLINLIGGNAIGTVAGIFASSLTVAAAADKSGFQANGSTAEFYSYAQLNPDKKTYTISEPSCYVVALTHPIAAGEAVEKDAEGHAITDWCEAPDFATSVGVSCTNGLEIVKDVSQSGGPLDMPTGRMMLAKPSFYAEINLQSSQFSSSTTAYTVALPRVESIFYPKSLLGGAIENNKSKHLALTVTFANPAPASGGVDYFKAASIAVDIFDIKPGATFDLDMVNRNLQTYWTLVPIEQMPNDILYKDFQKKPVSGPFRPINISSSLHEVGDPSVFLQSLAGAFASPNSTQAFTTAISNTVLPQGELLNAQNDGALQGAVGKYYSAVATYQTACATLRSDLSTGVAAKIPADRSNLNGAKFAAQSAFTAIKAAQLQSHDNNIPVEQSLSCPGT